MAASSTSSPHRPLEPRKVFRSAASALLTISAAILFAEASPAASVFGTSYTGIHHIGFEVDDIAKSAETLQKLDSFPRDDINSVLNPAMKDINEGMGAPAASMEGGHDLRNVEVKYGAPDGVLIDISQTGWVGTDAD